jgi:hypothetical protein
LALLAELDVSPPSTGKSSSKRGIPIVPVVPFERMTLRERKKVDPQQGPQTHAQSPAVLKKLNSTTRQSTPNRKEPLVIIGEGNNDNDKLPTLVKVEPEGEGNGGNVEYSTTSASVGSLEAKKAKKVILHVKPPSQRGD